jgi:hypothetical protein
MGRRFNIKGGFLGNILRFPGRGKSGRELRDEGMERVAENSGEWRFIAGAAMDVWFERTEVGEEFIGEDIRFGCSGVGEPHHQNAWSAVIGGRVRQWLKAGLIEVVGVSAAQDPTTHAHMYRRYKRVKTGTIEKEKKPMELFNLVAKPIAGECEARRCKNKPSVGVQSNAFERDLVSLCTKHNEELDKFLKENPDYKYEPPPPPESKNTTSDALSIELQGHADEGKQILDILAKYEIKTQDDLIEVGEWLQEVRVRRNLLENREKEITGPIQLSIQKVRELFQPVKEFWANAEVILKQKIKIAKLKEEEANREAIQDAADAHAAGDTEGAAEAVSQVTTVGDLPGISTRARWSFMVVDAAQVPRQFLIVNESAIRQHCAKYTSDQQPDPVPGVRFIPGVQVGVRTAGS